MTEHHGDLHHPKNKHLAERFEKLIPVLMLVAIVLLAIGMVYGIMTTDSTPSWMR